MKTEIKLTPEQLAEFSSRLQRNLARHDALAEATIQTLRKAGEERIRREAQPGYPKLKVPTLAQR